MRGRKPGPHSEECRARIEEAVSAGGRDVRSSCRQRQARREEAISNRATDIAQYAENAQKKKQSTEKSAVPGGGSVNH